MGERARQCTIRCERKKGTESRTKGLRLPALRVFSASSHGLLGCRVVYTWQRGGGDLVVGYRSEYILSQFTEKQDAQ